MTTTIGSKGVEHVSSIWDHTVFELETLAMGLLYVAEGRLPEFYETPSRDLLIGPSVGLRSALVFYVGHPGIGVVEDFACVTVYCSLRNRSIKKQTFVDLDVVYRDHAASSRFEPAEVVQFAEELYAQAKNLGARFQ